MTEVWIFRVEQEHGDLLYAAAASDPIEAERILRVLAEGPEAREVLLFGSDIENKFALKPGEIKGPM